MKGQKFNLFQGWNVNMFEQVQNLGNKSNPVWSQDQ